MPETNKFTNAPGAIFHRNRFENEMYRAYILTSFHYLFTNKTFTEVVNVNNYDQEERNSTMAGKSCGTMLKTKCDSFVSAEWFVSNYKQCIKKIFLLSILQCVDKICDDDDYDDECS